MAKSDLLKEAIADAKAVKETALANAKLALEEAFAPRLQSMLSHKLAEELEDEEAMEEELDSSELGTGDNAEPSAEAGDSSNIENDNDLTEEEDEMYSEEDNMDAEEEMDMAADSDEEGEEYELTGDEEEDTEEDDLDLEAVIRELEDAMASDEEMTEEEGEEEMTSEEDEVEAEPVSEEEYEDEVSEEEELDINEIIRTLKEMEGEDKMDEEEEEDATEGYKEELEEAYKTIQSMRKTINEVNLLNAKLLYTNKLFRTFDLNESQKVKVIENFDRASNLREVKLVFATLGENLNVARKKKTVVKESLASKPMKSTAAPKKILSEGQAVAERFKKLAGLIK